MITKINHILVAVRDLAEGVITYQKRFGLVQSGPLADTEFGLRLAMMGNGATNVVELVSPSSPDGALARFMEGRTHPQLNPKGEGPYAVNVEVEDLDAAVQRIEASGGQVVRAPDGQTAWTRSATTSHVLFELQAPGSVKQPGGAPVAGPTIRSVRSVPIAVHDLDASAKLMNDRFGLEPMGPVTDMPPFGFRRVALGYKGGSILQLNCPYDENSAMARFMRQRANESNPHGEGIYQVLVGVDSVDQMVERLTASGARIIRNPSTPGVAWPHPLDTHMVLMELQNQG